MLKNFVFLIVLGLFVTSCSDTNEDLSIPTTVYDSFAKTYPNAEEASWITLDDNVYEVEFKDDFSWKLADFDGSGQLRTVQHDTNSDGSFDTSDLQQKGPKTTISVDSLGQGAYDYIKANYEGFTITKAYKTTRDSVTTYIVVITNGTETYRLVFDTNWNFVKIATGHTGGGHSGGGTGGEHGGHGGNGNHGHGGNGDHHGSSIDIANIPAIAIDFVKATYADFTIHKAKKETYDGVEYNIIVIKDANRNHKVLLFDTNWVFVKEK